MTFLLSFVAKYREIWKQSLALAWPITVDKTLRTLMRTVDIIVTGFFSPAAIAAIGLADLYARFSTHTGSGVGGAAIALASQDTGSGNLVTRDESITQALLLGAVLGIPMAVFGVVFGYSAISVLGAPPAVAEMGSIYLMIIFLTAPARHVGYIASSALQGTGDTVTPMKINMFANAVNIVLTVLLGLGIGFFPTLEIIGVGIGTATGNVVTAILFMYAIYVSDNLTLVKPSDPTVLKQLIVISTPRVIEGFSTTAAEFPFNAILLTFGVEVNAAWQVARRLYQQITAPATRAANTVSSIIVGQDIGKQEYETAKLNGRGIGLLGILIILPIGVGIAAFAEPFVRIFTSDPDTIRYAIYFTIAYGLSAGFETLFKIFSGVLQGAGDTRKPLYAELFSVSLSYIVFTYVVGIYLGFGVEIAYLAIVLHNMLRTVLVAVWFYNNSWVLYAQDLMKSRGSI